MTKVWQIWQINFANTLKFFISVMAFKEIHQTLLIQIDFLANSPQTLVTPNFRCLWHCTVQ